MPTLRPPFAHKKKSKRFDDNCSDGGGILKKYRGRQLEVISDRGGSDRDGSPNFFDRLYDKIKAEYFDDKESSGSPQKSGRGSIFSMGINRSRVRNPSLISIKTEKRVSFMGESLERN